MATADTMRRYREHVRDRRDEGQLGDPLHEEGLGLGHRLARRASAGQDREMRKPGHDRTEARGIDAHVLAEGADMELDPRGEHGPEEGDAEAAPDLPKDVGESRGLSHLPLRYLGDRNSGQGREDEAHAEAAHADGNHDLLDLREEGEVPVDEEAQGHQGEAEDYRDPGAYAVVYGAREGRGDRGEHAHGQEHHAGLQGRIAEGGLEVEGKEEGRAEHPQAEDEEHDVPQGEVAVPVEAQVYEGVLDGELYYKEDDEADDRGAEAAQDEFRGPAVRVPGCVPVREGEVEAAEEDGHRDQAQDVEGSGMLALVLPQHDEASEQGQDPDGHVDVEDGVP